jgi:hypothetical protein
MIGWIPECEKDCLIRLCCYHYYVGDERMILQLDFDCVAGLSASRFTLSLVLARCWRLEPPDET